MKILVFLACLLAVSPALACINDRDTLAQEVAAQKNDGNGLPSAARAITGHFDRNPPLYYRMRLNRVAGELASNPKRLDLYDDAGAACDRLGRSDEALGWMEKKKQYLDTLKLDPKTKREHLYRYVANAGTFHAHLWLRRGANRGDMTHLKKGRDMIARAVQIKPDAHFGRERYQLQLMEWALNPPPPKPNENFARDFLGLTHLNQDEGYDLLKDSQYPDALTGLTGLIVLGDAWASLDVYHALMQALGAQGNSPLSIFAGQRCLELMDNGAKSLSPHFKSESSIPYGRLRTSQTVEEPSDIRLKYFALRADATEAQFQRDIFMMNKMQNGLHPDTDPTFWADWKAPAIPSFDLPNPEEIAEKRQREARVRLVRIMGTLLAISLAGGAGFWLGKRRHID